MASDRPKRYALLLYQDKEKLPIEPFLLHEDELSVGSDDWKYFCEFIGTDTLEFVKCINGSITTMLTDDLALHKKELTLNTPATGFYFAGYITHTFDGGRKMVPPPSPIAGRAVVFPGGHVN